MRKIALFLIIASFVIAFSGCEIKQDKEVSDTEKQDQLNSILETDQDKELNDTEEQDESNSILETDQNKELNDTEKQNESNSILETDQNKEVNEQIGEYEIIDLEYVLGDIKVTYIQISGMSDIEKQSKINNILKIEALSIVEEFSNYSTNVTIKIDYKITWKGKNLLSIQYSGYRYVEGSSYPVDEFYTTNIDIVNANILKLVDLIEVNKAFVEKFNESNYAPLEEFKEIEDMYSYIEYDISNYNLLEALVFADSINENNTAHAFCYFTEDAIGISLGVLHAIGDHAEFEIPYEDILNNIINENEVWKDFNIN